MSLVPTVLGTVDTAELGRTYMHEHIFSLTTDVQQNYPQEWGSEEARIADAVSKLGALAAQGVSTIVDPTVVGLGRYIPRIQRVAAEVPELNIIVSTGIYTYESAPFFFAYRGPALNEVLGTEVPDPMVAMFVGDITDGIAGTGVRAGMLKCAIDAFGLTPGVERVMRAVAQAHLQTGVPVTVHTHPASRAGLEVKRVLCDEEGVPPGRVAGCQPTAGTSSPAGSPPGPVPSTTRTASKASSSSSRPTTAPPGWSSPGGGTRPPSRRGCTRPRSGTGTAPPPNAAARRRRPRSASAASCGPTRSPAAQPTEPLIRARCRAGR